MGSLRHYGLLALRLASGSVFLSEKRKFSTLKFSICQLSPVKLNL